MNSYTRWSAIRDEHLARAGGEAAVEAGKHELLSEMFGYRLAEVRRSRGLTQQQVAERMGVTKGRVSEIEQGRRAWQPQTPLISEARCICDQALVNLLSCAL